MMDYIYDHWPSSRSLVTNGGERYDEFMHPRGGVEQRDDLPLHRNRRQQP